MADESESARSQSDWHKPRSSSPSTTRENVKRSGNQSLNNKPSSGCFRTLQLKLRSRAPCFTKPPGSKNRDATTIRKPPWQRCSLRKWQNVFAVTQFKSTADIAIPANIPLDGFIAMRD